MHWTAILELLENIYLSHFKLYLPYKTRCQC